MTITFLQRHFFIYSLLIIAPLSISAADEEKILELGEEITVTAGRIPTAFPEVSRGLVVISKAEIEKLPVQNIQDLLEYAASVDLKPRGPNGVQADVSIRGASFEQTLVLINGVKINDPQTGHHNMNIPLTAADIEKVEILKGPGSRLYGPNAFGGVINIITKEADFQDLDLSAVYGSHNFYDLQVSAALPFKSGGTILSAAKSASNGYRNNTDFDISTISFHTDTKPADTKLNLSAGYTDKKFGANSFYTPAFPEQWERTKTIFARSSLEYKNAGFSIKPGISWRHNKDEFLLERGNPDFYRNLHTTDVISLDLQASAATALGITAMGGEVTFDKIESNNLGNHERSRGGIFVSHQTKIKKLHFSLGTSAYYYTSWGWQLWPGIDGSYELFENSYIYTSASRAFRVPTYTDLYYNSPQNRGNPDLKQEESTSYEVGFRYKRPVMHAEFNFFRRENRNLIDWAFQPQDSIWLAENITKLNTQGIEASITINTPDFLSIPGLNYIHLSYMHLESDKPQTKKISRYVINHLKHQLLFKLNQSLLSKRLIQSWIVRYEDRYKFDPRLLVDARISSKFKQYTLFLDITNVFDIKYKDHDYIPMPGRWIKLGLKYSMNGKS